MTYRFKTKEAIRTIIPAWLLLFWFTLPVLASTPVGITPAEFSVDKSGAANYSVPIGVPPGRGRMQPTLSLNYNSQGRKRFQPEEIITKLREAEVLLAKGDTVGQVVRRLGVTEQTYYRWRKEYGGLTVDQAKKLKYMENENSRLKKLVADLSLDNAILKEFNQGKF